MSLKEEFEAFFNIAWHSRHMFCMYCRLYEEDEDRIALLNRVAGEFFGDLQKMWHEHVLLDICKLTDSSKGDLTINYFLSKISDKFTDDEKRKKKEFDLLCENLQKKFKPARNKIIAHIDKGTLLAGNSLGGLSCEEQQIGLPMHQIIDQFYDKLEEIINIVSSKLCGNSVEEYLKPLDPTGNATEELISFLKRNQRMLGKL